MSASVERTVTVRIIDDACKRRSTVPDRKRTRWCSQFACGCDSYTTLFRPVVAQPAVCHAHGETRVVLVIRAENGSSREAES